MEFIKTTHGGRFLKWKNHLFVMDKSYNGKTYWKCRQFSKLHCKSRIQTLNDHVVEEASKHSHAADVAELQSVQAIQQMKEEATTTQVQTTRA